MVTEILARIAIVISLFSFAFTYRVMRDQLTEDTAADLHAAVMKLIEIQGSMPDHPNTTRNAKNQVHHLALTVESMIEQGGEDLPVPVTGYLALGWSFELVEEDEKAEKYHQTACQCESANTLFSHVLTHRSLGRYYFNRGRLGDLEMARDAYRMALIPPHMSEPDRDDAAAMDVYTLLQWAEHEAKGWAGNKGSVDQSSQAQAVLELARQSASKIEDPIRRQKAGTEIEREGRFCHSRRPWSGDAGGPGQPANRNACRLSRRSNRQRHRIRHPLDTARCDRVIGPWPAVVASAMPAADGRSRVGLSLHAEVGSSRLSSNS